MNTPPPPSSHFHSMTKLASWVRASLSRERSRRQKILPWLRWGEKVLWSPLDCSFRSSFLRNLLPYFKLPKGILGGHSDAAANGPPTIVSRTLGLITYLLCAAASPSPPSGLTHSTLTTAKFYLCMFSLLFSFCACIISISVTSFQPESRSATEGSVRRSVDARPPAIDWLCTYKRRRRRRQQRRRRRRRAMAMGRPWVKAKTATNPISGQQRPGKTLDYEF